MTMRIWKDTLYQGTVHVPTGNPSQPTIVAHFGAKDIDNAVKVGKAKVAAGWRIPACWEHQEAWPVKLSRADKAAIDAKHTYGEIVDFRNQGGVLQSLVEVYDNADAKRLKKVKYCSPQVSCNWTDSTGKKWPGVTITHLAATPVPVQHKQQPWRLSRAGSLTIWLSQSDYEGTTVADDLDDIDETADPMVGDDEGGGDKCGEAISLAEELGLHLGEGTTEQNFFERFCAAAKTKLAHEGGVDDESDMDDGDIGDDQPPPDAAPATQPPPMSLSLRKQMQQAETFARSNIGNRIKRLLKTGRITPPMATKLENEAKTVKLSFSKDGSLRPSGVLAKLDAYEELPANSAWAKNGGRTRPGGSVRMSHRPDFGPDSRSDAEILGEWDKT